MGEEVSFRVLLGPADLPRRPGLGALEGAYAWPAGAWVRANFVTTLDGAVTGADGLSGSLGTEADRLVFEALRASCDAIVVGAGTVRAEDYGPPPAGTPLVVVSRGAELSERLAACPDVVLATVAGEAAERARSALGGERVWILGETAVSPAVLREHLIQRGNRRILHEGGPALVGQWLSDGCVDELCLTQVPVLRGAGRRLLQGTGGESVVHPRVLLEAGGALFGQWAVAQPHKG